MWFLIIYLEILISIYFQPVQKSSVFRICPECCDIFGLKCGSSGLNFVQSVKTQLWHHSDHYTYSSFLPVILLYISIIIKISRIFEWSLSSYSFSFHEFIGFDLVICKIYDISSSGFLISYSSECIIFIHHILSHFKLSRFIFYIESIESSRYLWSEYFWGMHN